MNPEKLADLCRFWAERNRSLQRDSRKPEAAEYFRGRAEVFDQLAKGLIDPQVAGQMMFTAGCYGWKREDAVSAPWTQGEGR